MTSAKTGPKTAIAPSTERGNVQEIYLSSVPSLIIMIMLDKGSLRTCAYIHIYSGITQMVACSLGTFIHTCKNSERTFHMKL